jgi:hypothetical protein
MSKFQNLGFSTCHIISVPVLTSMWKNPTLTTFLFLCLYISFLSDICQRTSEKTIVDTERKFIFVQKIKKNSYKIMTILRSSYNFSLFLSVFHFFFVLLSPSNSFKLNIIMKTVHLVLNWISKLDITSVTDVMSNFEWLT